MDDVHGFGPDPQVEKFKEDLAAHIWFRDGGVHHEGAEKNHLKRFRKRINGAMTIESNPKNLDARLKLLGLEGAKDVPTPSVPAHKEKLTTGELLSPGDHSSQTVCWRFALLHVRQSRCTVRGVNSGIDVGKTDSRVDDCSAKGDTLLEGNKRLLQQLELDSEVDKHVARLDWVPTLSRSSSPMLRGTPGIVSVKNQTLIKDRTRHAANSLDV